MKEIIDKACNCLDAANEKERTEGFDYATAYDKCIGDMQSELILIDEKYADVEYFSGFLKIEFDMNCREFYRARLLRELRTRKFEKAGVRLDSVSFDNRTWLLFKGRSDFGTDMELDLRFISVDTFEFISRLTSPGVEDSCEILINDIAKFRDEGSTFYLQLTEPRRVDNMYEFIGPWDHGRTELNFHFPNKDPTVGIFYTVSCNAQVAEDVRDLCKQQSLELPLEFVGTRPFTEETYYTRRQAVVDSSCLCFRTAVEKEKTFKFDFMRDYWACRNASEERIRRFDTTCNDITKLRNFEYRYLERPTAPLFDIIDSLRNHHSLVHPFESIASREECQIMKSGIFMDMEDEDSALIYIEEDRYIVKYRDGSKTKARIEWVDDQSFKIIHVKSNNEKDAGKRKGSETLLKILAVNDKIIYFETKESYSRNRSRLIKLPTPEK